MKDILNDERLSTAGEHDCVLQGLSGSLEAKLLNPKEPHQQDLLVLIGHPHSLHGGTMNNKVVTTLAKASHDMGLSSIRFNFRGVGESQGEFDSGIGESEDMLNIIQHITEHLPHYDIVLAGFSFGAYVTYRAACQSEPLMLISVAPAVNHGDFTEFDKVPTPWHVVCAGADEIVPRDDIERWHQSVSPTPGLSIFEESSHFFHGQLTLLKKEMMMLLETLLKE